MGVEVEQPLLMFPIPLNVVAGFGQSWTWTWTPPLSGIVEAGAWQAADVDAKWLWPLGNLSLRMEPVEGNMPQKRSHPCGL